MKTGLFSLELVAIGVSSEQFQVACKEALQIAGEVIAAKGDIASKDYPIWHGYPFGDVSFAHEISRWVAKTQGHLQGSSPDAVGPLNEAILEILMNACMWLTWRSMQAATAKVTEPEPIAERPEDTTGPEPELEPEPDTKPKRRLSLRRPS